MKRTVASDSPCSSGQAWLARCLGRRGVLGSCLRDSRESVVRWANDGQVRGCVPGLLMVGFISVNAFVFLAIAPHSTCGEDAIRLQADDGQHEAGAAWRYARGQKELSMGMKPLA